MSVGWTQFPTHGCKAFSFKQYLMCSEPPPESEPELLLPKSEPEPLESGRPWPMTFPHFPHKSFVLDMWKPIDPSVWMYGAHLNSWNCRIREPSILKKLRSPFLEDLRSQELEVILWDEQRWSGYPHDPQLPYPRENSKRQSIKNLNTINTK